MVVYFSPTLTWSAYFISNHGLVRIDPSSDRHSSCSFFAMLREFSKRRHIYLKVQKQLVLYPMQSCKVLIENIVAVDNSVFTKCNSTTWKNDQNVTTVDSKVEHLVDVDKMNVSCCSFALILY